MGGNIISIYNNFVPALLCGGCGAMMTIPWSLQGKTEDELRKKWNTRKPMDRIVERLEERTEYFKDCTKYGNETEEQEERSYSTMMMYEVAYLVDDLIEIVKEEGGT